MSTLHSKGPWAVHRNELLDIDVVRSSEGKSIAIFAYRNLSHNEEQEQKANAARIVDCVNACEGQDIETVKLATAHRNDCLQLEKVNELALDRNERLRSALQGTVNALQALPPSVLDDEHIQAINDANEVLTELRLAQKGGSDEG